MQLPEPPKITSVEVVAAQPTEADHAAIAHMGVKGPAAVYVVKVRLKAKPPVTSMAWRCMLATNSSRNTGSTRTAFISPSSTPSSSSGTRGSSCASRRTASTSQTTDVKLVPAPSVAERNAIKLPLQADVLK